MSLIQPLYCSLYFKMSHKLVFSMLPLAGILHYSMRHKSCSAIHKKDVLAR